MNRIRKATLSDIGRIAEIEVFNYRLNFYPMIMNDDYYFGELTVAAKMECYRNELSLLEGIYVYDDGVVKGFASVKGSELEKLFVEPLFQSNSIGGKLLEYCVDKLGADHLWSLERNIRGISFYQRHGFVLTDEKRPEEGTDLYLIKLSI